MKKINFSNTYYDKLNPLPKTEVFFWIFLIISLFIKGIYFQFTTGLNIKPFNSSVNSLMALSSFCILLMLSATIFLVFRKYRCLVLLILDILLTILIYSDTVYFRYYSNALTVPVLFQIGLIGPLGNSIKSLIKFSDLIYIFDFPFLIAGLIMFIRRGFNTILFKKRIIIATIGLIIGIASFFYVMDKTNTLWFPYDKNYVSRELGIVYFHYYDVTSYLSNNVFVDKSLTQKEKTTVSDYFKNKKAKDSSNFQGIAKNKNLIIVQLEAFQQFVINRKINGKEITPNFNKLLKESVYFDNFFYQVGEGNTADAEFLSNNSLYPATEGAVYFRYPNNTYHALPSLLKQQGYNTYSFHAFNPSFWNRDVMYKTIGFDKFFSMKDFSPGPKIGFGLNDEDFLTQSIRKINKSKPFYGFMITLSSHFAYAPFEYTHDLDTGKYEHTELGNYFKAANYVDKSIGTFINELKNQGLYDNTVLAFYGDHFMMPKGKADQLLEYLKLDSGDLTWTENEKVPLIIHYPGVKNGVTDNTIGGEIDVLPTLANLLDIDTPFALGKDLLNTKNGYAVLRNGSVITDKFVYVNEKKAAYDPKNGKLLDKAFYEKDLKDYTAQLNVSDIILKKNAFKVIK